MTPLQWRAAYGCWRREVMRFLKDPFQTIVSEVFSDLLFFALIWLINRHIVSLLVPGLLLFALVNVMFSNLKMTLFIGRLENVLRYQLIAPVPRPVLMTVFLLSSAFRAALISALLYGFLFLFGAAQWPVMPGYFLLASAGACVAFGSLSLIVFLYTNSWNAVGALENYIKAPLLTLSGCFFSFSLLPEMLQQLLLWNPVYHFVNLFRFFYNGTAEFSLVISLVVCCILTISALATALLHFHKGWRLLQ